VVSNEYERSAFVHNHRFCSVIGLKEDEFNINHGCCQNVVIVVGSRSFQMTESLSVLAFSFV
jgi:hypothetical protein